MCNKSDTVLTTTDGGIIHVSTAGPHDSAGSGDTIASWLKHHRTVLQWACFNAFELKDHPDRGLDHIFLVQLETVVLPTARKRSTVKTQIQITNAQLVTRNDLVHTCPGVMTILSRQDEASNFENKVHGSMSTNMLVQNGDKWHSIRMVWDQVELEGLEREKDWVPVLMSMTMGQNEFEMVDGNPVRQ